MASVDTTQSSAPKAGALPYSTLRIRRKAKAAGMDQNAQNAVKAFWAKHDQVDGKLQTMARSPSKAQPAAKPPAMAAAKAPPSPPRPPSSVPVQNNSPQANLQNPYAAAIPVAQFKNAVQYLRKSSPTPGGY